MLSHKMIEILEMLLENDYISGSEIAEKLDISEKTARSRVNELMDALVDAPADLEAKKGKGYRLNFEDSVSFTRWLQENANLGEDIPQTAEERVLYILEVLLGTDRAIKRQELCDRLYVSEKTISADLKQIGNWLEQYALVLTKSRTGVSLDGSETRKRMCILGNPELMNRILLRREESGTERDQVTGLVKKHFAGKCSEYGRRCLVDYLLVMAERNRAGFWVEDADVDRDAMIDDAGKIMQDLTEAGILSRVQTGEVFYLSLYMKVGLMQSWDISRKDRSEIPAHIRELVEKIIRSLYETYHIDYRSNHLLQEALALHLVQLDIRIRYGIRISNPLQENVRSDYMASYMIAQQAVWELTAWYGRRVPSSEVGYFAMLFEMYQDTDAEQRAKMNVLLVSSYNELATQYLYYLLKKDFGDSVGQVRVCQAADFGDYDLGDVQLVIASEMPSRKISVPVIVMADMMSDLTMQTLKKRMTELRNEFIRSYFSEELFFTGVDGDGPEEVIRSLCRRIEEVCPLPAGFCESVLKRERLGHTDLGYYTAIPHPCSILTEEPMVAVAILRKPVFWHQREVRLVILSSLSSGNRQDDRVFFRRIGSLISDKAAVKRLLEVKKYETLLQLVAEDV
uniref:BglG family transcription antiterminator n=1 Tax=Eubacterium cellulosolvens TaxID=29322 RepID=UPI0012DC09A3|nr:HTH domain-containing protein [[Eubacterium] cellulosolvens]